MRNQNAMYISENNMGKISILRAPFEMQLARPKYSKYAAINT